jgi:multidrug efflux pump subunit AcrB
MRRDKAVGSLTTFIGTGAPRFYLPLDQILPQSNVAQLIVMPADAERATRCASASSGAGHGVPATAGPREAAAKRAARAYPVQFRVIGPDAAGVRKVADQVRAIMAANPNTVGVNDNWNENVKMLRLELDQDKARALGVTTNAIARATQAVLTGVPVGQYRDADKLIDIVMRTPKSERDTMSDLNNILVPTSTGRAVPLTQVARVTLKSEPGVLWRENRDFGVTVQSDIVDGIQGPTVTAQIDPKLDAIRASLPPGYRITIAGAQEESGKAGASIAAQLPLCIFLIFTLLMLQLHSFSRSVMVFLTGPLGLIAAATLLLLHAPMGFVAQLGITALLGMIIRNSVILVDQIEQDIKAGIPPWQAIVESAVRRARPIMLTAAAAVLAMIPLSRSTFWGPMAAAIMGGLIVATVLTLLFLPALYAAWFRVRRRKAGGVMADEGAASAATACAFPFVVGRRVSRARLADRVRIFRAERDKADRLACKLATAQRLRELQRILECIAGERLRVRRQTVGGGLGPVDHVHTGHLQAWVAACPRVGRDAGMCGARVGREAETRVAPVGQPQPP